MGYLIGIDEVGRGCLAGPVVVAALLMPENLNFKEIIKDFSLPPLRDSKRLSISQRSRWANWVKKEGANFGIVYAISRVSPDVIDRINISNSANRAAFRSLKRLILNNDNHLTITEIILDGGLYLNNKDFQKDFALKYEKQGCFPGPETKVKADTNYFSVGLASIMAKVCRDRLMDRADRIYPGFNFSKNKGYGTEDHILSIRKLGPSKIHRRSFVIKNGLNRLLD